MHIHPCGRHWRASSSKALAVMAMMGMVFASARSSARMALVAVSPSITGIIISIMMPAIAGRRFTGTSAPPHCHPSQAPTLTPRSARSAAAISAFSALSSTKSRCRPLISFALAGQVVLSAAALLQFQRGSVMVKTEPTPSSLSIVIVPCISSIRLFTIAMPSPVP